MMFPEPDLYQIEEVTAKKVSSYGLFAQANF